MTAPAEDLPETTSSKPDRQPAAAENPSGDLSGITELFGLQGDLPEVGTRTEPEGGRAAVAGSVAAQLADATGRLIEGRYRLIAELGVGGMGITYRAWDARARVPVVVKMPNRQARNDAAALIRFAREIAAMEKVLHESIVPITDHGMDEGSPFVVMRFLPGGSLADYRRRDEAGTPLRNPPGMLHFWLPGVAAALDHIHAMGMLHRDVKPGNVFLDGFLKPFLGDFGIAKVVDESGGLAKEHTLTATRMAVGTPEYMAPELFRPRSRLDGRVDQYALAVTVYEMLAGEKPFTGSTAHIIVEHSSLPVPPLEQTVAGLPRSLCDAVHRGLAKDPAERFATCAEFAAAAVADLVPLEPEAETVRLLCPACKNILKLPQRAAGRSGRCPRCQSVMDVAADLGSLWLESEERGESPPVDGPPAQPAPAMPANAEPMPSRRDWAAAWKVWRWGALVAGLVACFAVGRYWSDARLASENRRLSGSLASATTAKQSTALPIDSLTVEQAEKLVATGRPLDLDGLTTLSPEVAAVLGRHQSSLSLNGLDAMTIEA
ncbi:MAG: serine/threonine-protein kinase, partial [Planctomycetia bacterium]